MVFVCVSDILSHHCQSSSILLSEQECLKREGSEKEEPSTAFSSISLKMLSKFQICVLSRFFILPHAFFVVVKNLNLVNCFCSHTQPKIKDISGVQSPESGQNSKAEFALSALFANEEEEDLHPTFDNSNFSSHVKCVYLIVRSFDKDISHNECVEISGLKGFACFQC